MIEDIVTKLVELSEERVTGHTVSLTPAFWSATDHASVELRHEGHSRSYFVKMARTIPVSERIVQEATILTRLKGLGVKNIPDIIMSGSCDGRAYLVEGFVDGVRLKGSRYSKPEKLRMRLDWLKEFYSQTLAGTVDPNELVRRAEKVNEIASGSADLTGAISLLEACKPADVIPTVCWHGDPYDINFIATKQGIVATDFAFARFGEPPSDPYVLVPVADLTRTKELDLLATLQDVDPFFLATYESILRLGEELRIQRQLEENLLLFDDLRYFPSRELGKVEALVMQHQESK